MSRHSKQKRGTETRTSWWSGTISSRHALDWDDTPPYEIRSAIENALRNREFARFLKERPMVRIQVGPKFTAGRIPESDQFNYYEHFSCQIADFIAREPRPDELILSIEPLISTGRIRQDGFQQARRFASTTNDEDRGTVIEKDRRRGDDARMPRLSEVERLKVLIAELPESEQREILADITARVKPSDRQRAASLRSIDLSDYTTIRKAARELDLEFTSIQRAVRKGQIPTIEIAGQEFISLLGCRKLWPHGRRPAGCRENHSE